MAKFTWDHIHLRTPDPEATAQWFEKMLGAEIIRTMQQGAPRIDMKIGGANVFLAPVKAGDGVNAPPVTPYRASTISGFRSPASTPSRRTSRPRASSSPASRPRCGRARASASSAARRACRSNCSTARSRDGHEAACVHQAGWCCCGRVAARRRCAAKADALRLPRQRCGSLRRAPVGCHQARIAREQPH